VQLVTVLAALALGAAACGEDGTDFTDLTHAEACRAVKERLSLEKLKDRFGEPDGTQDFFGDTVVAYEGVDEVRWQFQVSQGTGTFRALTVKGSREEQVRCP
jgi:hypothetical protein